MKIKTLLFTALAAVSISSCDRNSAEAPKAPTSEESAAVEVLDLSYAFDENSVYWVTAKDFKRETVAEGKTDKGYYYSAYNYEGAEHGGTHIDSPVHFAEGRLTVDKIPLERLMGEAVKVDVSSKAASDRDYLVSVEDLAEWEKTNGVIPQGAIVLLQTGYGKFYPDKEKYLGTAARGEEAVKDLHFPGLHPDAAKWLVSERKIKAVGIDTASIDRGQSTLFESHVALMTNDVPAFENVANLESVPAKGFRVTALPMKIKGGSGAPLRIIAEVRK